MRTEYHWRNINRKTTYLVDKFYKREDLDNALLSHYNYYHRNTENSPSFEEYCRANIIIEELTLPDPVMIAGRLHPHYSISITEDGIPYGVRGRLNVFYGAKVNIKTSLYNNPYQRSLAKLYFDIYGVQLSGTIEIDGGSQAGQLCIIELGKIKSYIPKDAEKV